VARELTAALGIDAPLIEAINLLIDGSATIDEIVAGLMARPLRREH
jgi:glycerol-3-phosphate dehydrogenase (NAD(P)+)